MATMTLRVLVQVAALCGVSLAAAIPVGAQGVTVALVPNGLSVSPDAEFDLSIQCTQAGSPFNGFDAVIGYDPAALTFIELSPVSLQEGSYMKEACGNTFHVFRAGADTDTITDVLLCNGLSLPGPGQLYRLHFRASSTPQVTAVRFLPGLQFYDAGLYVNPVYSTNAVIGIGMPAPVGVDEPLPARLSLRATPNPGGGRVLFAIAADRSGLQGLVVRDLQGRAVRRLGGGWFAAGTRTVEWDGRDDAGARLPAGIYFVTLDVAGRTATSRVTLLP